MRSRTFDAAAQSEPSTVPMQAEKLNVTWDQTTDEVLIKVPIAADVKGKDIKFEVHPKRLQLQAKGSTLLDGGLEDAGEVDLDGKQMHSRLLLSSSWSQQLNIRNCCLCKPEASV